MIINAYFNSKNIEGVYIGAELIWKRFSPTTIFSESRKGVWYDISDLSTLFQDASGTIPVTKDGDPVGLILDKSGNVGHATQSISASRPTYKTDGKTHRIELDGVDDFLILPPSLNLSNGGVYLVMQSWTSATRAIIANNLGGYIAIYLSNISINNGGPTNTVDTPSAVTTSAKSVFRINKTGGYLNVLKYGSSISSTNSVQGSPTGLLNNNILGAFSSSATIPIKADFYGIVLLEQHLASDEKKLMQYLADQAGV